MRAKTKSETLFENLCNCHHIKWSKVPSQQDVKTPDYEISVPGGRLVVTEVKQFDPNREEQKALDTFKPWDAHVSPKGLRILDMPSVTPGDRIRSAIKTACPQLKARASSEHPALLVVYNNNPYPYLTLHTEPYAVLTAMRGLDAIDVIVPNDPSIGPKFSSTTRPGPKKKMTSDANTSISAIGVLYSKGAGVPAMDIYHNRFAKICLHRGDLAQVPEIRHFRISDDENNWEPL